MSYRVAPGHQNHTPFGRALREYNGNEGYKHTVRGINPVSIYDNKYEGYRRPHQNPMSLTSAVLIVILIVVAIILFGYIIHCWKHGVSQDPEYFEKVTVYGGSKCPSCGSSPCVCEHTNTPADDIFEEIKEPKSNVVVGSTEDYIKGGSDEDDFEQMI